MLSLLTTALLFVSAVAKEREQSFSDKWRPDYLDKKTYTWTHGESYCVRLLTREKRTGCGSLPSGTEAQLRYVHNETALATLNKHNDDDLPMAVVLPLTLISDTVLRKLQETEHVKGVIFTQSNSKSESPLTPPRLRQKDADKLGFSVDSKSPLSHLKPEAHASTVDWNPSGTGLMYEDFNFPMIVVRGSQSSTVNKWAKENENDIRNGDFGHYFAEFNYRMFAKSDSESCFDNDECLPVGGYSVWSSFEHVKNESNVSDSASKRSFVFGVTSMDTLCLFHQNLCRGADSSQSGLASLLAAVLALSGVKDEIRQLDKQIVFAVFHGESLDLMGSRKFTHDLNGGFKCKNPMTSYATGCWEPYSTNIDFLNLTFSQISHVVELNQVGIGRQNGEADGTPQRRLYAHYERNIPGLNDALITEMQDIATEISSTAEMAFAVQKADDSLPGTPPSSFWSFLHYNNQNLSGVVLTDFDKEYTNKWFHSVFDSNFESFFSKSQTENGDNDNETESSDDTGTGSIRNPIDLNQLCMASTLFARSLFKLADASSKYTADATFMNERINADCNFVRELFDCLTRDMSCDIVRTVYAGAGDSTPSHYSGVFHIREDIDIGGTPQFVFRFLANATRVGDSHGSCKNANDCLDKDENKTQVCAAQAKCVRSQTAFHSAVDPNIVFDYGSKEFKVQQSVDGRTSYAWAEATWPNQIGTRFYKKESDEAVVGVFVIGLIATIVSMIVSFKLSQFCNERFKNYE